MDSIPGGTLIAEAFQFQWISNREETNETKKNCKLEHLYMTNSTSSNFEIQRLKFNPTSGAS